MTGFTSPNHTQTPNDLFDVHMMDMGECELKVALAIIRKTLGFHKKSDQISLTQLQKLTGLSRQGVIDGTEKAISRGIVEIVGTGKRGVLIYGLVINFDQSENQTDEGIDQSKSLTRTSQKSRHTKESVSKEKNIKKVATPSKKIEWVSEDAIILEWARIRNMNAAAIGATIETPKRRASARRMLKWSIPLNAADIADAIKASKSNDYEFTWLEDDVPKRRALRANLPIVIPEKPIELVPPPPADDKPIDRSEEMKRIEAALVASKDANSKPHDPYGGWKPEKVSA
jgi:phage replication O-like protein O